MGLRKSPTTLQTIRPAAVAGQFYPGSASALRSQVLQALAGVARDEAPAAPKMLLVPHAGYIYSAEPVAAHACAALAAARERIRRVVLLGPAHRVAVRGLAMPTVVAFETPLGRIALDREASAVEPGQAGGGSSRLARRPPPSARDSSSRPP